MPSRTVLSGGPSMANDSYSGLAVGVLATPLQQATKKRRRR
jgi:hypothetical protein